MVLGQRQIDIIHNVTAICPHDCAVCSVDAVHVVRQGDYVLLREEALEKFTLVPHSMATGSIYDTAARHRQALGLELTLPQKLALLENLDVVPVRLDASGGDILCVAENYEYLQAASARLGRENVTLTATGAGLSGYDAKDIVPLISEFNFTFDSASLADVSNRPRGYAKRNLDVGRYFAALGCSTRAEFPISRSTLSLDHLSRMYRALHASGIAKLLLMRLFPVGRGADFHHEIPRANEYREAISILRQLEQQYGSPKLYLQCALRHIETDAGAQSADTLNPCDMLRVSFGLMPDGTLLLSPWAVSRHGIPLDNALILGNLVRERLSTILELDRVKALLRQVDQNFGHCKVFAFLNSRLADPMSRLLDTADPLYVPRAPSRGAPAASLRHAGRAPPT